MAIWPETLWPLISALLRVIWIALALILTGVTRHFGVQEISSALIRWSTVMVIVGVWYRTWFWAGVPEYCKVTPCSSEPLIASPLMAAPALTPARDGTTKL